MTDRISPPPLLEVDGLAKAYGPGQPPAASDLAFRIGRGELAALLGPSGCGKTTTLRLIGGFEAPDAGVIRLDGRDITNLPPERRGVGFVFQDYALFPHLSVLENVKFGLRRAPRREADARAREMLALVGLADLEARRPHELSGGQQQRVALARTLVVAPPLILLDEPFSNLDAAMRVETRQEVRALLRKSGSAAILVTHDQEEALALADRVIVMESGRIRQIGAPDDVHREPANAFVAGFIGRSNILPGRASGGAARTILGELALLREAHGDIRLAIRPEQIALHPDEGGRAVVIGREFRGHDQLYWIRAEDCTLVAIVGLAPPIGIGNPVRLEIRDPVVALGA